MSIISIPTSTTMLETIVTKGRNMQSNNFNDISDRFKRYTRCTHTHDE